MKEIASVACRHLTFFADGKPVPLVEVTILTVTDAFAFNDNGDIRRSSGTLEAASFTGSPNELRNIASDLAKWADDREALEAPATQPETVLES